MILAISLLCLATAPDPGRPQEADRTAGVESMRTYVTVCALAAELRLREKKVRELEPLVAQWLKEREPTLEQSIEADIVGEAIKVPAIRGVLLPMQVARLERMRRVGPFDLDPRREGGRGFELASGRYPEDDFCLEALAIAQHHGWEVETLDTLLAYGERVARAERRSGGDAAKRSDPALFKPRREPHEFPTWVAMLQRERARHGTTAAAPGPWIRSPAPRALDFGVRLIGARVKLLTAMFDERLQLTDEQRRAIRQPLQDYVTHEYFGRVKPFGMVDRRAVWNEFDLDPGNDPRRRSDARRELWDAVEAILDERQNKELGLVK